VSLNPPDPFGYVAGDVWLLVESSFGGVGDAGGGSVTPWVCGPWAISMRDLCVRHASSLDKSIALQSAAGLVAETAFRMPLRKVMSAAGVAAKEFGALRRCVRAAWSDAFGFQPHNMGAY